MEKKENQGEISKARKTKDIRQSRKVQTAEGWRRQRLRELPNTKAKTKP